MTGVLRRAALAAAVVLALPHLAPAQPKPEQVEFFEKKIRPLFAEHCLKCHGTPGEKVKGGLKLTARAELLAGGDGGPAVVPGDPAKSALVQAVQYAGDLKMPPKGKLKDGEIADLTKWVKDGAAWPEAGAEKPGADTPRSGGPLFTAEQKAFWAFQPVRKPAVPTVRDPAWVKSPIDAFVLAKLEAAGLTPAPPADKRTLIRRVTFDLTGLPPTPEEVEAFVSDDSLGAFAKVVDRLLASPAYGERWARHWLDVARYADSNGLDENTAFGNAWRYRDYVVRAFNADKPFDRFVKEQVAGDLLPDAGADGLIATGFLVLGPKVLAEPDKEKMVMDIVDEQVDVVSKAFLGLTVACARCHDHKFDPIPTRDYYALAGIFKSTKTMATLATVAKAHERSLGDPADEPKVKEHEKKVAALDAQVKKHRNQQSRFAAVAGFAATQAGQAKLDKQLADLRATPPPVAMALAVQDEAKPADVKVHIRGNHLTLGEDAPRMFPRILVGESQTPVPDAASGRLQLAEWVASKDNPLTARVIVNRVWQHHFGEGIVRSPDNFGKLGDRPTHPELLDWLAARFMADGWSLKRLHRLVLLSSTYQMSAAPNEKAALADPDNRLLWRFNRRRLEAEAIRDGMLAVAGTLDRTTGGTLLTSGNFEYVTNDQSKSQTRYDAPRRSLYLPVVRNNVFDFFQAFDFVEPHVPNGKRAGTVVAPQALYLMNNPFVTAQAKAFADSLLKQPGTDDDRVGAAYLRAFARPPKPDEVSRATSFLKQYEAGLTGEQDDAARRAKAWQAWCQVLFASSEFVFVE